MTVSACVCSLRNPHNPVLCCAALCWFVQTLLAASSDTAAVMEALPAAANLYPLAKLMLATVESAIKVKVSCSLQALTHMLVEPDRKQVGLLGQRHRSQSRLPSRQDKACHSRCTQCGMPLCSVVCELACCHVSAAV